MKNLYFTIFVLLLVSINTYSQIPSYVPTNGLVGWWPFNGNANDESGNGNNGTNNGATLTTDRNGNSNSAYSFNGVSNYIEVHDNISLKFTNNYSISLWINLTDYSGFNSPKDPLGNYDYMRTVIGKPLTSGWATGYGLGYFNYSSLNNNINPKVSFSAANMSCCSNQGVGSTSTPQLNNWVHLVGTYDGTVMKFYFNNSLESSKNTVYSLNISTQSLFIGKEFNTPSNGWYRSFKGKIDDIAIYNRALTQQEVTDLYNSQTCSNPTATITPQGNTTFCQGGFVNLNASTGSIYTYEWYKDGSLINGVNASVYQATTSGNYTVKVIDGTCNATSAATSVVVNAIPNNTVSLSGNTTFCQGANVTLTAQGTGTYLWSNGATTKAITVNQTGNYYVVVSQNGCSSTSNQTAITVNPLPTATITPQSTTTFCQGGFVNLLASGGSSYQWNTGAQTASISANQSGTYTVNVFNQFNCQATASQLVTVNTNPTVTLNALNSVVYKTSAPIQLVGNPSGGTYSGNAVVGSTFTPANATLGKKTISYAYTSPQGCSGSASQVTVVADTVGNVCSTYDTLRIQVHFTAGLYANTTNTIKFYPNPTKDILFIDNGNFQAMNGYSVKIVSLAGAVVYNQQITSQQVQISMNQFGAKGLYIAQIIDANNAIVDSKKIVLE